MATSEVCKVLIDVMRSPEIRTEPDGNVFIDPRQVKVALLCGVPRHRLGPLFVQRNHQWIKEADGASFRAALAASAVNFHNRLSSEIKDEICSKLASALRALKSRISRICGINELERRVSLAPEAV